MLSDTLTRLLLESLIRWKKKESDFVALSIEFKPAAEQKIWFRDYCSADSCPLCVFLGCMFCPLADSSSPSCCVEWSKAYNASVRGELKRTHIDAIIRRIEQELDVIENQQKDTILES